jgi:hypothetical protein
MADQKEQKDKFWLTYHIKHHEEGIQKDQVPDNHGASDALLVMSKLLNEIDSTEDYAFIALDGKTGQNMTPQEVFKAWVVLANMLKDNLPDGDIRKDLCFDVLNIVYNHFDKPNEEIQTDGPRIIAPGSKSAN